MFKVNLVNLRLLFAAIAILAFGATACTREKPASPLPTPTPVAPDAVAPMTSTLIALSTPLATPGATDTPGGPPAPPTSQVPSTIVTVPTVVSIPTVAPATSTPPALATPSAPGTYTVQLGDWLNKIAGQFGVTTQDLLHANPGINPNFIYPGQVLKIPTAGAPSTGQTPAAPPVTQIPGATGPTPVPGLPTTYTVQRGDWTYAIARRFGISVDALQRANPNININVLYPGQVIKISGGTSPGNPGQTPSPSGTTTYTVRPGDTLFTIAVRFGTTQYAIQIANNLTNPNFIYPGQVLVIQK